MTSYFSERSGACRSKKAGAQLLLDLRDDWSDGDHRAASFEPHHANALGRPARLPDLGGLHPDDHTVIGDDQDVLVLADGEGACQDPYLGRQHRRLHAQSPTPFRPVFAEWRALAVAVVG